MGCTKNEFASENFWCTKEKESFDWEKQVGRESLMQI